MDKLDVVVKDLLCNPGSRKIAIVVAIGWFVHLSLVYGQNEAAEETDDFLIVDDEIRIDSEAAITIYGNVTTEVNSKIINNGECTFSATDDYREIYNNASDSVFSGSGYYSFQGKKHHYLMGNYNASFRNVVLEKGIASSLVSEVPEFVILNRLELKQGVLDVQNNLARIENADTNAIDTEFLNIYSFINGRLIRRVRNKGIYQFPISSSRIIHPIKLTNNFPEVNYMEVAFTEGVDVDLSAEFGLQNGIAMFKRLDQTGLWDISADVVNPEGSMDIEAYIRNFNEYTTYEDNMFGLMQSDEIEAHKQNWEIDGELEYYGSQTRRVGTQVAKVRNADDLGYYAMGIAERQKFVNLIAPGGGRETRFIIQGLNIENPEESQYDNENCELVLYNIHGAEVWRKKPYENDLDLKNFKNGTYYYEFRFSINGKFDAIQSYIDVKSME